MIIQTAFGNGSLLIDQLDVLQRLKTLQQLTRDLAQTINMLQRPPVSPLREGTVGNLAYYGHYGMLDNVTFAVAPYAGCYSVSIRFFALNTWDFNAQYGYDSVGIYIGGREYMSLVRDGGGAGSPRCEAQALPSLGFWTTYAGQLPGIIWSPSGRCYRDLILPVGQGEDIQFVSNLNPDANGLDDEAWIIDKNITWSPTSC